MLFSNVDNIEYGLQAEDKQTPQMAPNQQESRLASALLWWHINFAVCGHKSAFGCLSLVCCSAICSQHGQVSHCLSRLLFNWSLITNYVLLVLVLLPLPSPRLSCECRLNKLMLMSSGRRTTTWLLASLQQVDLIIIISSWSVASLDGIGQVDGELALCSTYKSRKRRINN